jgi:hypothetical protein
MVVVSSDTGFLVGHLSNKMNRKRAGSKNIRRKNSRYGFGCSSPFA